MAMQQSGWVSMSGLQQVNHWPNHRWFAACHRFGEAHAIMTAMDANKDKRRCQIGKITLKR